MKPMVEGQNQIGLLEYLEILLDPISTLNKLRSLKERFEEKNDQRIEMINWVKASKSELDTLDDEENIVLQYIRKEEKRLFASF